MRHVEEPLLGHRIESSHHVPQRQLHAGRRRVGPRLLVHRVGALPHLGRDPVTGFAVRVRARHPRTEFHERAHVPQCTLAVERTGHDGFARAATALQNRQYEDAECRHSHLTTLHRRIECSARPK